MSVGSIKEHFTLSSSIIKLPWLWSSFQGQSAAGGRIAAFKIMMATNVIRRLIREERIFDIPPILGRADWEECRPWTRPWLT